MFIFLLLFYWGKGSKRVVCIGLIVVKAALVFPFFLFYNNNNNIIIIKVCDFNTTILVRLLGGLVARALNLLRHKIQKKKRKEKNYIIK